MNDALNHRNVPLGLDQDGTLQIESIEDSGLFDFGPGFYGFVEADGSGWSSGHQEIRIASRDAPHRIAFAINVADEKLPLVETVPSCNSSWIDMHGTWQILIVDIMSKNSSVILKLKGESVAEPRGAKRDLAFRFSRYFGHSNEERQKNVHIADNLHTKLPLADFISIFDEKSSPHFSLNLLFENTLLKNAYLIGFPSIIAVERGGRLVPISESNPYQVFLRDNVERCARALPKHLPSIAHVDNAISLCGNWADNFWHWWCEFLPYAVELYSSGWTGLFIVPSGASLFVQSLCFFGIPEHRIIPQTTDVVNVDTLVLPKRLRGQYVPSGFGIFLKLNRLIAERVGHLSPTRKLYIARRSSRVVRNEAEIFTYLQSYDFELVFMEDHSISEQIALAYQAKWIIGPHGAGMTAALFMQPGGTLVEFFGPTYVNPCMLEVCEELGHRYAMVVSRIYRDRPYEAGDDLDVDMPSLQAIIRTLSEHAPL